MTTIALHDTLGDSGPLLAGIVRRNGYRKTLEALGLLLAVEIDELNRAGLVVAAGQAKTAWNYLAQAHKAACEHECCPESASL